MNLQQLEYIVAVDMHRHFVNAAKSCFVTQATLSMMIQKLEDELQVKIFDRSKQPVVPTESGIAIIAQAKIVLFEAARLKEIKNELSDELKGELRLGIIPTLAPYLLPLFLNSFLKKYPKVRVKITELFTEQIIEKIKNQSLDAAILATPLRDASLKEQPLFYEQFVVYASAKEEIMKKKYVLPGDIDVNHLWLLEEGHCLRSQIINLCELRKKEVENSNFEYQAGSIETLRKMVDMNNGITVLPELAVNELTAAQKKRVRYFKYPYPVREISIVTYRHFVKQRLLDALKKEIIQSVPEKMRTMGKTQVLDI
jgi:LysR family transcriptional regulator, hydrogen peroxide-inducible genes activator